MTSAPRPLVAANWKMNGLAESGRSLAAAVAARAGSRPRNCDIAICPPATLLSAVGDVVAGGPVALGGQDCAVAASGAFTGDISAPMLADAGCRYAIVGHSERRAGHGESNALVKSKAAAARATGLVPIVCLGETEAQRLAGRALGVVGAQLSRSVPWDAVSDGDDLVIAYEPVWAIGTGRVPSTAEIAEVHAFLRSRLTARLGAAGGGVRLLYGGSVKPGNAVEIMAIDNVNGGLIGGASLNADDFWAICESCAAAAPNS